MFRVWHNSVIGWWSTCTLGPCFEIYSSARCRTPDGARSAHDSILGSVIADRMSLANPIYLFDRS